VELKEFRLFLMYLRQYLELYHMFQTIDSGDSRDRRIDFNEFEGSVETLNKWGAKIEDAASTFKEIDSDGGGKILFDEFAAWAIKRGLDLEDDDDAEFEDVGNRGASNLSRNQLHKREPLRPKPKQQGSAAKPSNKGKEEKKVPKVDWAALTKKLCFRKTKEEAALRQKLFRRIDTNGNGLLSVAEMNKGIRDELRLPAVFHSRPAVLRAFQV